MNEIIPDDALKVAEWVGLDNWKKSVLGTHFWQIMAEGSSLPLSELVGYEESLFAWLLSAETQKAIMKKIWTFAALHLEEIPKPEAMIMPFCDIAGREDYEGHGATIEEALLNAVLKLIEAEE